MSIINYAPFDDDGRRVVRPADVDGAVEYPGTRSTKLTNGVARLLIKNFIDKGWSGHAMGATMWVILTWAKRQDVAVEVFCAAEGGYVVKIKYG